MTATKGVNRESGMRVRMHMGAASCLSSQYCGGWLIIAYQDLLGKLKEGMDLAFRLFITALPNDEFPLGLLQMCTKVMNEQ